MIDTIEATRPQTIINDNQALWFDGRHQVQIIEFLSCCAGDMQRGSGYS